MRKGRFVAVLLTALVTGTAATGNLVFKQGRYILNLVVGRGPPPVLTEVNVVVEDSIKWWARVSDLDSVHFDYAAHHALIKHTSEMQDSMGLPCLFFEAGDSSAVLQIDQVTVRGPFRWDTL